MKRIGLGLVVMVTALGCSGVDRDDDESEGSASAALRMRNCALLTTCPNEIPLVAAVDFGDEVPDVERPDVVVAGASDASREFQRRTFGPLTVDQDVSLTLSGATPTDAFTIDDLLLFEVLDAQTNARITAAYAGNAANGAVNLDGAVLSNLGPAGTLTFAAGSVDLGTLLPKNRAFKLRVTAVDTGGEARTSKIVGHVMAAAAAPPPVAPVDPFDPASCPGPTWSAAQALAKFAPATTTTKLTSSLTIAARTRSCGNATGCTAWSPTSSVPYRHRTQSDLYGHLDTTKSFALPPDEAYLGLALHPGNKDTDRIRLRASFRSGTLGANIEIPFSAPRGPFRSDVGQCTSVPCFNYTQWDIPDGGDTLRLTGNYSSRNATGGLSGPHVVTSSCARLRGVASVDWANKLGHDETEYVILGRY